MYIINTSFFVNHEVAAKWLELMYKEYIPLLKEHNYKDITFSKALSEETTNSVATYSLMVEVESMQQYLNMTQELFNNHCQVFLEPLFGDSINWLITVLKKIDHQNNHTN